MDLRIVGLVRTIGTGQVGCQWSGVGWAVARRDTRLPIRRRGSRTLTSCAGNRRFLLFLDEFSENIEGHSDQVHALFLFLAEPILEAAFAPPREIGFVDVRMYLGREPRDDVFVFGV